MSDLLSAWVLSSSGSAASDNRTVVDPSTGLSSALDQARLGYHAQEVRRMAGESDNESFIKESKDSNISSKDSRRKSRRKPPSKSSVSRHSMMTDSGVVSGSNSTVTDTDRWVGMVV